MANNVPITGGSGSGMNDWITQPAAWDVISLAGIQTSVVTHGLLKEVEGFDRDLGIQEKRGKGSEGSTLTVVQLPCAKGRLLFEVWTQLHLQTWATFRQLFLWRPTPGQSPTDNQAIQISYPSLDDLNISSVLVKKVSPVKRLPRGKGVIRVELWEFIPVPAQSVTQNITLSNATPKSNMPAVGATPTTTAQKLKSAIAALTSQMGKP